MYLKKTNLTKPCNKPIMAAEGMIPKNIESRWTPFSFIWGQPNLNGDAFINQNQLHGMLLQQFGGALIDALHEIEDQNIIGDMDRIVNRESQEEPSVHFYPHSDSSGQIQMGVDTGNGTLSSSVSSDFVMFNQTDTSSSSNRWF